MHVGVLASLLAPQLQSWGYLQIIPEPGSLGGSASGARGSDGSTPELRLVRACFSYQDHKGGVLCQESGQMRLRSKPLAQPVDARQWKWKNVLSCGWHVEGEHINALEARALLLALRWRSRSAARFSKRFLHLTDSKVALGSYAKHRSNSRNFNYIVTRSAALQLASSMVPVLAYVRTDRNPADLPSWKRLKLRPSAPASMMCRLGASDK